MILPRCDTSVLRNPVLIFYGEMVVMNVFINVLIKQWPSHHWICINTNTNVWKWLWCFGSKVLNLIKFIMHTQLMFFFFFQFFSLSIYTILSGPFQCLSNYSVLLLWYDAVKRCCHISRTLLRFELKIKRNPTLIWFDLLVLRCLEQCFIFWRNAIYECDLHGTALWKWNFCLVLHSNSRSYSVCIQTNKKKSSFFFFWVTLCNSWVSWRENSCEM